MRVAGASVPSLRLQTTIPLDLEEAPMHALTPVFVRRTLLAAALSAGVLAATPSWSQQAPVRLIVGYAAGGPVDAGARQFAPVLSRELGRSVVVENRPGAAGALGGEAVARAAPDGSMLYFGASPTMTITPHVMKTMPFDPSKDLVAISPVLSYANMLVINKDLPFKTLPELIAYAKANPGKLSYGSAGMGASNHLSGELLAKQSGVTMTHVPYKGNAPAMTDVIGGQLSMMFDIVSTARNYAQSGRVLPLAVTSRERNASLPNVPTMREAGLPGYEVIGWYGVYGPAHMKPELVTQINAAVNRALGDETLRKQWADAGYDQWTGAPSVLAAQQRKDLEMWRDVTKGIKFD
jgi:tripartite-type tricarboxylate transporter receptor subunit TctC